MKQVDFLYDINGNIMVDKIIRYENLEKEFHLIAQHLGIQHTRLPHVNKSKRKPYAKYYSERSKQMVYDLYKKDIEAFNYTFDGR